MARLKILISEVIRGGDRKLNFSLFVFSFWQKSKLWAKRIILAPKYTLGTCSPLQLQANCWPVSHSVSVKHILMRTNPKEKRSRRRRRRRGEGSCRLARHRLGLECFHDICRHEVVGKKKIWHQLRPLNNAVSSWLMIEARLCFKGKHPSHSAQLNKFHSSQRVIIPRPPHGSYFLFGEA